MKVFLLYVFLSLCFSVSVAAEPVRLTNDTDKLILSERYYAILEDSQGVFSIEDIIKKDQENHFKENERYISRNNNPSSVYWQKFELLNESEEESWVFELYDHRIEEIEIFVLNDQTALLKKGGANYNFGIKDYHHKNFAYDINLNPGINIIYCRIQSDIPVSFVASISSPKRFSYYSNTEYFFLALFYGIIFTLCIYNTLLYFSIKDVAFIYYVFYLISLGFFCLSNDGLGFQYLWPDYPIVNKYVFPFSIFSMLFWALLLARKFLSLKKFALLNKLVVSLLIFRVCFFLISITLSKEVIYYQWIDFICFLVIYVIGLSIWIKGYAPARFFVLAFTFQVIGLLFNFLYTLDFIKVSFFTVYGFNVGSIFSMFLISYAFADKIKFIVQDREMAQQEVIEQLRKHHLLKDKLNKELEEKVKARTFELEEKNKELDAFVYKASHDIKGPLKSIIGLTSLGLLDTIEPTAKDYFSNIEKCTIKLDNTLMDMLEVTKRKNVTVEKQACNCYDIIQEVRTSLSNIPGYADVEICIDLDKRFTVYTDRKVLYSIFQNLIENAIKYRSPRALVSFLKISAEKSANETLIEFSDNGKGIDPKIKDKVFDMFFKASERTTGTGLGLYIVKTSVEKLGGSINLETDLDHGCTFTISIPD